MRTRYHSDPSRRRGSILMSAMIVVVGLAAMTAALLSFSLDFTEDVTFAGQEMKALYVAEAGIAESVVTLVAAVEAGEAIPLGMGNENAPMELAGGSYWSQIVDNGDDSYTIRVRASAEGNARALEIRMTPGAESAFDHAIFAGNSSGDPNYSLSLGGVGSQADGIDGNIYSGGAIDVNADADVNGDLVATNGITTPSGSTGSTGISKPILDIASMDYAINNDVDVAAIFSADGYSANSGLGGNALQVPEESPAHIFRLNPSDRPSEINGTAKDDYFLEDPYEAVKAFNSVFGNGHEISLSGTGGNPGVNGNELVYYIDGNLWIHNAPMGGMRFGSDGAGTKVTFVINGNLYVSDDVVLDDDANDALAFIAVSDPNEPDSGNIYLGDPRWGTLELMNAYLYAENNFYDNNLSSNGSSEVVLNGNMTAGNHVDIQRDYVDSHGNVEHSRLEVNFDDRLSQGTIQLPGLPDAVLGLGGLKVAYWSEVGE